MSMHLHFKYFHSTFRVSALGAAVAALSFAAALAVPATIVGAKPDSSLEPRISDTRIPDTVNRAAKGDRLRVIVRPPGAAPFEVQGPAGSSPKSLDGCESSFGQMDHSPAAKLAQNCVT
jgi:ABC-type amino acid transport substrate-binding protein